MSPNKMLLPIFFIAALGSLPTFADIYKRGCVNKAWAEVFIKLDRLSRAGKGEKAKFNPRGKEVCPDLFKQRLGQEIAEAIAKEKTCLKKRRLLSPNEEFKTGYEMKETAEEKYRQTIFTHLNRGKTAYKDCSAAAVFDGEYKKIFQASDPKKGCERGVRVLNVLLDSCQKKKDGQTPAFGKL